MYAGSGGGPGGGPGGKEPGSAAGSPIIVRSIQDFVEFVDRCCATTRWAWFRGQASDRWPLRPSFLREKWAETSENNMLYDFKRLSRNRHIGCPDWNDAVSWLLLAQHYQLPTRLLDWTDSPLVGLYFSLTDDQSSGALWALDPYGLNELATGRIEVPTYRNPQVVALAEACFEGQEFPKLAGPVAFVSDNADPRMYAQSAVFTFHTQRISMEVLRGRSKFLSKALVPADVKSRLRKTLLQMGISEATIFPDLDHLSAALRHKYISRPLDSTSKPNET